ncbi:MAG: hypothetical protein IPP71_01145 [Bacteroidetes bacterium]|nr:hypothetical protein [Bacteroidota bacterium]
MLSSFYRLITWAVLLIAVAVLICQLTRGIGKMMHHGGKCDGKECVDKSCPPGSMKCMMECGNRSSSKCGHGHMGRGNCDMKGMHTCCKEGMGMEGNCPMMDKCGKNMSKEECAEMCKNMGMKDCCNGDMANCPKKKGGMMHHESSTDTVDGKIIKKEIDIIEKLK